MAEIRIQAATFSDAQTITRICAEHAAFERAAFDPEGHESRLTAAMQNPGARVVIFLAETGTQAVGFAAVSREFSTWRACDYLHLDCLYVIDGLRGRGIGKRLIEAVTDHARLQGFDEVQWQTPEWNTAAIKFYRTLNVTEKVKVRFTMQLL